MNSNALLRQRPQLNLRRSLSHEYLEPRHVLSMTVASPFSEADVSISGDPGGGISSYDSESNPAVVTDTNQYITVNASAAFQSSATSFTASAEVDSATQFVDDSPVYFEGTALSHIYAAITFTSSTQVEITQTDNFGSQYFSFAFVSNGQPVDYGSQLGNSDHIYVIDPGTYYIVGQLTVAPFTEGPGYGGGEGKSDPLQLSWQFSLNDLSSQATLSAGTLQWDTSGAGGVDVNYNVSGAALPMASNVSLYWASGQSASSEIGAPILTESVPLGTAVGSYGPFNAQIDPATEPAGATDLIAVADPSDVLGNGTSVQALALPNLTALASTAAASGSFFWNSVAKGGGFTFSYTITNPSNAPLPNTSVVFSWQTSSTPNGNTAYVMQLTEDALDNNKVSLLATGEHTVTITQAMLNSANAANGGLWETSPPDLPTAIPTQSGDYLDATIDPNKLVLVSTRANDLSILAVVPLVVDIVTHGFNPLGIFGNSTGFLSDFNSIGTTLQQTPSVNSVLYDRVTSYVANWDSTTNFLTGFLDLFGYYANTAENELFGIPSSMYVQAANADLLAAQVTAGKSDTIMRNAAADILVMLQQSGLCILPADQSNALGQRIVLVGHSRGADLNSLIAKVLTVEGYQNVDFIGLDEYSSDWTGQGGVLSKISTSSGVAGLSGQTLNYISAQGLAFDSLVDNTIGLPYQLNGTLQQVQQDTVNALKAPSLPSYDSNVIFSGTTHTTISPMYAQGLAAQPGISQSPAIQNNFIWQHRQDGLSLAAGNTAPNIDTWGGLAESADMPSNTVIGFNSIADTGFVDGDISELGSVAASLAGIAAFPSTGSSVLDTQEMTLLDPSKLASLVWSTSGDVTVRSSDASSSLELNRLNGDASIGQSILFASDATAVSFNATVEDAEADDTIQVMVGTNVIDSIPLSSLATNNHIMVPLQGVPVSYATVTVTLHGTASDASTVFFNDFQIDSQAAPQVTAVELGGTTWSPAVGSYSIPSGSGQTAGIPTDSVNQITLRFSEGVNVSSSDLSVSAGGQTIAQFAGFSYDVSSASATWTLPQALGIGKVVLSLSGGVTDANGNALEGGWTDGSADFPSGSNGAPADFVFSFDIAAKNSVSAQLSRLPLQTSLTDLPIAWTGSGSSAIKYSVSVGIGSGDYQPWIQNSTSTSAVLNGQIGQLFAIQVTASDQFGNEGSASESVYMTLTPWTNPTLNLDTDGNGEVTPIDALIVINYLNKYGAASLPQSYYGTPGFIDTNGDNVVTPIDALRVINYLNSAARSAVIAVSTAVAPKPGASARNGSIAQPFGNQMGNVWSTLVVAVEIWESSPESDNVVALLHRPGYDVGDVRKVANGTGNIKAPERSIVVDHVFASRWDKLDGS